MGVVSAPAPLTASHISAGFECGTPSLDEWLVKRASRNQQSNASRTFVICKDNRVIGYYALATGSVERHLATSNAARNMPDPIPVIILARLAIDKSHSGQGQGGFLLRDALLRSLKVADQVGVRAVLLHAISDTARRFYEKKGFRSSPADPMTLMLPIKQIEGHIGSS